MFSTQSAKAVEPFCQALCRIIVGEVAFGVEFLAGIADKNFRPRHDDGFLGLQGLAQVILGAGGADGAVGGSHDADPLAFQGR